MTGFEGKSVCEGQLIIHIGTKIRSFHVKTGDKVEVECECI